MKSKQEIKQWLIENALNENGCIDLEEIDFGDLALNFNGVKANYIYNQYQNAEIIYNDHQKAREIMNDEQLANVIYNNYQKAKRIVNSYQTAYEINYEKQFLIPKYNNMSKEELVKILEKKYLGDE